MSKSMPLPARLDTANASTLLETINKMRGQAAVIDGGDVTHAGALGLQVLVAAKRKWTAESNDFTLVNPSEQLMQACQLLGIDAAEIGYENDGGS